MFKAIAAKVTIHAADLQTSQVADVLVAFATVGTSAPDLFNAVSGRAAERIGEMSASESAATMWALAIADPSRHVARMSGMWKAACTSVGVTEWSPEDLERLRTTQTTMRVYGGECDAWAVLQNAIDGGIGEPAVLTATQLTVSKELELLGWRHEQNVPVLEVSGLTLAMADRRSRTCFECDGDGAYIRVTGKHLATVAKGVTKHHDALLKRLGWTVVRVAASEYERAAERGKGQSLLKMTLREKGVDFK